jgi:Zn-dependent protease with chaperone function
LDVDRHRLSRFEQHSFLVGVFAVLAGMVLSVVNATSDGLAPGGPARFMGLLGLEALAVHAFSRAVRLYRRSVGASLPRSIGKVDVRIRPRRIATATTVAFPLVLPAAAGIALVTLAAWGWLAIGAGLLVGGLATLVKGVPGRSAELYRSEAPRSVSAVLDRLCMRADVPVPVLVVEPGPEANAWTTGGRIHLTKPLLKPARSSRSSAPTGRGSAGSSAPIRPSPRA